MVERLLEDLASLEDRVWLVIDDLHELSSADALRQTRAADHARARRTSVRPPHPARPAARPAPAAGGGGADRDPRGRPAIHPAGGAALLDAATGAALPDAAVAAAATTGPRAGRPGCGWTAAVAGLPPRPGALRGRVRRQRAHGRRVPAGRGAGTAERRGPAAAVADLDPRPGQRRACRPANRGLGRRAGAAAARGGRRRSSSPSTRVGPGSVTTSSLRRSAPARAAGQRPGRTARAARCRGRLVRRTRVSDRGGPARSGRPELGAGRPACCRTTGSGLGLAGLGGAVHEFFARFPRRGDRGRRRTGGRGGRGPTRPGLADRARNSTWRSPPRRSSRFRPDRRGRAQAVLGSVRMRLARQSGDITAAVVEAQRLLAPAAERRVDQARARPRPARARADQPGHRRALDVSLRRGRPAPRRRHRPRAARSADPIWRSPAWRSGRS